MDKRLKLAFIIGISAFLISAVFGIAIGSANISLSELFSGEESSAGFRILVYLRLPRVIASILSGAALAVAGAIIQAVLNNPLAAPNIIGVNAGAGLFTVISSLIFPSVIGAVSASAFVGAVISVFLVYFIAKKTGASRMTLILAGVAVSSLLNAVTDAVVTLFPNALADYSAFRSGGTSGVSLSRLTPAWIFILVGIVIAIFLSRDLDILSHGELTAASLGMKVGRIRLIALAVSALLAGSAVSMTGLIGFVGLVVPHIIRRTIKMSENVVVIPLCALYGGTFLNLCDMVSRSIFSPYEIPLGVVVSVIGVPLFLYLLLKSRSGRHAE